MRKKPTVLFLCNHNAGRSLAAKVLLDHYAAGEVDVRSAGSNPASDRNPSVVALLAERGLDPSREFPKALTEADALESDVIITMGCGDKCPVYLGKRYVDWDLDDPAELAIEEVRPIIEDIDARVQRLLRELTNSQI